MEKSNLKIWQVGISEGADNLPAIIHVIAEDVDGVNKTIKKDCPQCKKRVISINELLTRKVLIEDDGSTDVN